MSEDERLEPEAPLSLDDILDDDLLTAPEKPQKLTSSDRLERAFLEIVEFRRAHDRVPSSSTREIAERKLGARLDGFLADDQRAAAVKHLDEFGLLEAPEAPASIDELLEGDDLGRLHARAGRRSRARSPLREGSWCRGTSVHRPPLARRPPAHAMRARGSRARAGRSQAAGEQVPRPTVVPPTACGRASPARSAQRRARRGHPRRRMPR